MGNTQQTLEERHNKSNHHHTHHLHFSSHHRRNSARRTSLSPINSEIEQFVKSIESDSNKLIPLNKLVAHFSYSHIIKEILITHSSNLNEKTSEADLTELKIQAQQVLVIFSDMYQTATNSGILELYINLLFAGENELQYDNIYKAISDCFRFNLKFLGYQQVEFSESSVATLESITNSIRFTDLLDSSKRSVTKSNFKDWAFGEFPQLFYGYHNWFLRSIRNQHAADSSGDQEASGLSKNEDLSKFLNSALVWYFINNLPSCYLKNLASENGTVFEKLRNCLVEKQWKQLYNSENHGLSLNRFQSNLFNYKAPTILFIYCYSGNLYCICNNEEYKESPQAYGDDQIKVYRIWKTLKIFDLNSTKNIYLNTRSRGLPLGLIFGYSQLKPILKINEDFSHVDHESVRNDQIISVEVWGCGCKKASESQASVKNWETKQIEKMRTVKLNAETWSENADKSLLDLAGIRVEHSERGDV